MESNVPRTRSIGRPARGAKNPRRSHAREPGAPATACPAPPPIERSWVGRRIEFWPTTGQGFDDPVTVPPRVRHPRQFLPRRGRRTFLPDPPDAPLDRGSQQLRGGGRRGTDPVRNRTSVEAGVRIHQVETLSSSRAPARQRRLIRRRHVPTHHLSRRSYQWKSLTSGRVLPVEESYQWKSHGPRQQHADPRRSRRL